MLRLAAQDLPPLIPDSLHFFQSRESSELHPRSSLCLVAVPELSRRLLQLMHLHELLILRFSSTLQLFNHLIQVGNIFLDPLDALVLLDHTVDHFCDHAELLQPLLVLFEGNKGRHFALAGFSDELDLVLTADDAAYLADLELLGAIHDLCVELKAELGFGPIDKHRQQLKKLLVDFDLDCLLLFMHQ